MCASTKRREWQLKQGDTTMFPKTMIALAIVLGTAPVALAAAEQHNPAGEGPTPFAACTLARTQMPAFFQDRIAKLYGPAGECAK
jgi:hypothetical protein